MSYVDNIISKFGGIRPLASRLDCAASTVQSWKVRGSIPDRKKAELLRVAADDGVDLSPADFFGAFTNEGDAA